MDLKTVIVPGLVYATIEGTFIVRDISILVPLDCEFTRDEFNQEKHEWYIEEKEIRRIESLIEDGQGIKVYE